MVGAVGAMGCEPHGQMVRVMGAVGIVRTMGVVGAVGAMGIMGAVGCERHGQMVGAVGAVGGVKRGKLCQNLGTLTKFIIF